MLPKTKPKGGLPSAWPPSPRVPVNVVTAAAAVAWGPAGYRPDVAAATAWGPAAYGPDAAVASQAVARGVMRSWRACNDARSPARGRVPQQTRADWEVLMEANHRLLLAQMDHVTEMCK
eukprot:362522-Chlamydomonas_euryale.AAC.2